MPRPASQHPDAPQLIARFLVAAIEGGSKITLRERMPVLSFAAPYDIIGTLTRAFNALVIDSDDAIKLILHQVVTVAQAAVLSGYTETDILSRIERGELGGLCVDGVWLLARSGADELARSADTEKWFREHSGRSYKP
jgi:hypothetical protein